MESIDSLKGSGNAAVVGDLLSTPSAKALECELNRAGHVPHHLRGTTCETREPTKHAPIHPHFVPPVLEPLAWIAGLWSVHEPGKGIYPTIKDFTYAEKIEFSYSGQKMLDYKAESWNPNVGPTALMHREVGFLRIKPDSNHVALVIAHNFGVSEILEGTNEPNKLTLTTNGISRITFAANPEVILTKRTFTFDPVTEELEQVMEMQTTQTPLTKHLCIKYKRVTHQVSDGH